MSRREQRTTRLSLLCLVSLGTLTEATVPGHQERTCGDSPEAHGRVVSIGDLHGDWEHTVAELAALGLVEDGHWVGGDAILVQTGDVVDRGDHSKQLLELLFRVQDEAKLAGGRVELILGNHELMNMQNDLRYSTATDILAYGGLEGHRQAWAPEGQIGRELRRRGKVIALVDDVVYSHAGLLPSILDELLPADITGALAVEELNQAARKELDKDYDSLAFDSSLLLTEDGPFWTRLLATSTESEACPLLERTLKRLAVRRMIVGHTAQESGNVRTRCGGRLILGDTLMSEGYTGSNMTSEHNAAAIEYFRQSSHASAIYPLRKSSDSCNKLDELPDLPSVALLHAPEKILKPVRPHRAFWQAA